MDPSQLNRRDRPPPAFKLPRAFGAKNGEGRFPAIELTLFGRLLV
jgi:hypothetical protein